MEDKLEAVYLLDDNKYLHLKEEDNGFKYALFDKEKREKINDGLINWAVLEDCLIQNEICAARKCVIDEIDIRVSKIAKVSLNTLEHFKDSDIRRRKIWEPETLPEHDIRFINSHYDDLFRIEDGGAIEIHYPNETAIKHCKYVDEYHAKVGDELFHICQFAEQMERLGAKYEPEREPQVDQFAWKVGKNHYLTIQSCDDGWDYTIYDKNFNEFDGGQLDMPEFSILEARNEILADFDMDHRNLIIEDYETILEVVDSIETEKRNIILANKEVFALACNLANFCSDFDLYEFNDNVNVIDLSISSLKKQILSEDTNDIKKFLKCIVEENDEYKDLANAFIYHLDSFKEKYPSVVKNESVVDKLHHQIVEISNKEKNHKSKELER